MLAVVAFSIVLMWMLCTVLLVGMGALVLRGFNTKCSLFSAFWVGLCSAVALLQIYQFFRPIDAIVAGLIGATGLCGIVLRREALAGVLREEARVVIWPAICSFPILAVIAARCSGPAVHYDTGFYGATVVRWLATYPIVPGLTNLLQPIGFNSNVFLCVAALNQGPWRDAGFHVFVGLLLCTIVVTIAVSFARVLSRREEAPVDYFALLFSIPCMVWVLNWEIVGTNTDLPTTIVSITAVMALFRALQKKTKAGQENGHIESVLLVSMMLFTLAVTFKLSSLMLSGLGWCVAVVQLHSLNRDPGQKWRLLAAAIGFSCVLAIPWICRGIILSGYPLFPSSALAVPVDWRVPRPDADLLSKISRSWARIPHAQIEETAGLRWVRVWLAVVVTNRVDFIVPIFISFAGIVSLFFQKRLKDLSWFRLLLPSLGGLIFWLAMAPALRFGEAAIWTTAACLGTVTLRQLVPRLSRPRRFVALFGLLAVGGLCSYPRTLWRVDYRPLLAVHGFPSLPHARTMPDRLSSGLTVQVPVDTNQCWESALPCSPYFTDNLRLRHGDDLRWGFRADGPDLSLLFDKFTPLHRQYVRKGSVEEVCWNCHLPSK